MNVETARKAKGFIGAATKTVIQYIIIQYYSILLFKGDLKKLKKINA